MSTGLVLFPHQLFKTNVAMARDKITFLVEDALYFAQYAFHQQKLVLHRASMQAHADHLRRHGCDVRYIDSADAPTMRAAVAIVIDARVDVLHYFDPVDDWLERRLRKATPVERCSLCWHPTPMFLSSPALLATHFEDRQSARMAPFYTAQRKALDILVKDNGPVGGRWSFDTDNRKRLPASVIPPPPVCPEPTRHVVEARSYVAQHFGNNPGVAADFAYPVTYDDADRWLEDFLRHRFAQFGDYEDAIRADAAVLFHSLLSPLMNVGLLSPQHVIESALAYAGQAGIAINAVEGFVRQVIGWREFVRGAYVHFGRKQRTRNHWQHRRPLPASFYDGTTGIDPVDCVIRRVLQSGYAHHIERLMVLGCFMQLCEFDPDHVYRWFMEMFVDAYDWVMVPNVYGMALFADGGLITTKPYLCGSSYILRMSDFKRGPWCDVWDALYWRFIATHRTFFSANARSGMMVRQLDRMDAGRIASHLERAETFLAGLARGGE